MMFVFKIKDNNAILDVAVLRILFIVAAFAAVFLSNNPSLVVRYLPVIILLIMALFAKVFLLTRNFSKYLLLVIGAALLFISLHSLTASIIFFIAGIIPGLLYKAPAVEINKETVVLKRMIGSSSYHWKDFNNIVLKDTLLTLDFKNNKVLQLEVDDINTTDETIFNNFCSQQTTS